MFDKFFKTPLTPRLFHLRIVKLLSRTVNLEWHANRSNSKLLHQMDDFDHIESNEKLSKQLPEMADTANLF